MGAYRLDVATGARAGCNATTCKKMKIKIKKGELRLGSWIEGEKFQSWSWRHWGCVTPKVLSNIASSIEENGSLDFELIEGFYGLPEELQDKVKQAIEQGEIDPSDVTVLDSEAGSEAPAAKESPVKVPKASKKTTKRARADDNAVDEAATKKGRKSTGKAEEGADEPAPKKPRKSTSKAAAEKATDEKPAKRGRGRKATVDDQVEEAAAEPKKARGRKKKVSPTKEEGADDAEPEPKPAKKRKIEVTDGEDANGEKKPKRGRAKKA